MVHRLSALLFGFALAWLGTRSAATQATDCLALLDEGGRYYLEWRNGDTEDAFPDVVNATLPPLPPRADGTFEIVSVISEDFFLVLEGE